MADQPKSESNSAEKGDVSHALFKISEKVLCLDGTKLYEAKVLNIRLDPTDNHVIYFLHYRGWDSKKWDEWVDESLILKWSEENEKIKNGIDEATGKENKVFKKGPHAKVVKTGAAKRKQSRNSKRKLPETDISPSSGSSVEVQNASGQRIRVGTKRRKINESVEPESLYNAKQEINIELPSKLKQALFDDWNYIFHKQMVSNLPAEHTVDSILNDYVKHVEQTKRGDDETAISSARDLCFGLKEYFNNMVVSQLLYPVYEKEQLTTYVLQLEDANLEFPIMSAIYGPYHLLRLFTKLGQCLTYTALEPESVKMLVKNVGDFLNFLDTNFTNYFDVEADSSIEADMNDSGIPSSPVPETEPEPELEDSNDSLLVSPPISV